MKKIQWKQQLIKSIKIAVAAVLAIAIAGEWNLDYAVTAGIITILSIQNTKRETLKTAAKRGLAFLSALVIAAFCFGLFSYTLWAFACYLFCFSMLCLWMNWVAAISMASVLISHLWAEQSMAPQLIANEAKLFVIGTSIGILVNMHLHKRQAEFEQLAEWVDHQMKCILRNMSAGLAMTNKRECCKNCFEELETALDKAKLCAALNYNNSLLKASSYELEYISMREQQSVVLKEICENIRRLQYQPRQALQVARFIEQLERDYHRKNTVEGLLVRLEEFLSMMQKEPLPKSRAEFEARAILFYILMQLRMVLQLKRDFVGKNR